jgi:hypothetical protein
MNRKTRDQYAATCPRCVTKTPELRSHHLMPGATCKRDGYVDPRPKDWQPYRAKTSEDSR